MRWWGLLIAMTLAATACASAPPVPRAADGALVPAVVELEERVVLRPDDPVPVAAVAWIDDPDRLLSYRAWLGDDGAPCLQALGREAVCFHEAAGGMHGGMDPEWCAFLALPPETARAVIETVAGRRLEMTRLLLPEHGANVFGACWIGTDTRWLEHHDGAGALLRRHRF